MSKKISELTETIEPQDNDVLAIVNGNETKKVKLSSIIAKIKTAFNSVYAAITHTHTKSEITDFPTLSNVATSGSYNDLSDKPSTFTPSSHNHKKSEITDFPTKVSAFTNDSGYLTSYTETDPTVPSHVKSIKSTDITNWNNKSNFSGSYNDLTDKPTIPSAYTLPTASASTLGGVKVGAGLSISNGVLSATGGGTADSVDWANIQNKPSTFTPSTHKHTKSEITDFPTIPSKTSQLTNDSNYATTSYVDNAVANAGGGISRVSISMSEEDWNNISSGEVIVEFPTEVNEAMCIDVDVVGTVYTFSKVMSLSTENTSVFNVSALNNTYAVMVQGTYGMFQSIEFIDIDSLNLRTEDMVESQDITRIVKISQEDYDNLASPYENTLYLIPKE